jgi:hypothetical protein
MAYLPRKEPEPIQVPTIKDNPINLDDPTDKSLDDDGGGNERMTPQEAIQMLNNLLARTALVT